MTARLLVRLAVCLGFAASALAQAPHPSPRRAQAPPRLLDALSVRSGAVAKLTFDPAVDRSLELDLGGVRRRLVVAPHDLRGPDYQLLERRGGALVPVEAGPTTTFRGAIDGRPGSRVALHVDAGSIRALVVDGDRSWAVQPLRDVDDAADPSLHVVYRGADVQQGFGHCGVAALAAGAGTTVQPDSVYECELALEADHALFLLNTSNTLATQNEVLGVLNAVDVIFQNDLTVTFQVPQLVVDVTPDPYTTSVASQLLGELQTAWNTTYAAVPRDVVHLFSGRAIGAASGGTVGFAYDATVCDPANAYGLSETRWSANFALRAGLVAHELGHNFGASHCDLTPACSLMCSAIGQCSGVTASFGATAVGEMQAYLQSVGCLTVVPTVPQISSASPALVATVAPPMVTLGGSGFLGTTTVTIGGQPLVGGFTVLSDTQLCFTPPAGLPLGVQMATVSNPAGTSNATFLVYQASDPCQLVVPDITQANAPFTWRLGGWPNGTGYLGVSLVDSNVPLQGFPVLSQFLTLWSGPLDARGMATVTVPQVPALLSGFPFYSQLIDGVTGTGTVRSASLVYRTLVL
ncbi:MAG: zinc-dependent metalloprotease family protein [Planctomycetota bacterium]